MSEEGNKPADGDKELDALLNSALEDFVAGPPAPPTTASQEETEASEQPAVLDTKWTEEFVKQAAAQFEQNMQSLMALSEGGVPPEALNGMGTEDFSGNFQRVAEAAARAIGDPSGGDFSAAISETLRNLSAGAENIQGPISDADLQSMLGNLSLGEGDSAGDLIPFMQNMMQSLLSKEILYPALKDVVDKYPAWFEKQTALEESERVRYTKQRDLMVQVCTEMEQESESDSPEVKNARFNRILELMQQLQECGQPPDELVGDISPIMNLEDMGNPMLSGLPGLSGLSGQPQPGNPNCNVM